MPVHYLNPVPVYYSDLSQTKYNEIRNEINNKLEQQMFSETTWNDLVRTTHGYHDNIVEKLNLKSLHDMVIIHVKNFLNILDIDYQNIYFEDSWFNILEKYGFQNTHVHFEEKDYISGVYYHDIFNGDKFSSLVLELKNEIGRKYVDYQHRAGRIILFHSSVPHRVTYNKSNEPRKSFSFNIKYETKIC